MTWKKPECNNLRRLSELFQKLGELQIKRLHDQMDRVHKLSALSRRRK